MKNLIFLLCMLVILQACTVPQSTNIKDDILFSIDGQPVKADDFFYVYEKNNYNNDSIYTEQDIDNYFDLFVNFKLKIAAAKAEGQDTLTSFLQEYNTYKKQLIKPYLAESKEQEKLVREAYERMKYEINAAHILVQIGPDASPEDTLKAYQKMLEIYEKAKTGQDFEMLANKYSEDPSAKRNNGRLGYFTAFQMVYPFENAAYNTPPDSVSSIFRTRFGYHILKVYDRRTARGEVQVSHIMLRKTGDAIEQKEIKNKIFEIHDQLLAGADWNEMCQKYSEDYRTKDHGGKLPFIGLRQINDQAFEDAAFGLTSPGDISDPVQSQYGWHVIRLEHKKALASFDTLKDELEQKVSKDQRSQISRRAVVTRLKKQNNFQQNDIAEKNLLQYADNTLLNGQWKEPKEESWKKDTFFIIDQQAYTTWYVARDIQSRQRRRTGISPQAYMGELIKATEEKSLLDNEAQKLVANNRDLRMLLNEYYEGILLFNIMNQKVWNKATNDTLGLKKYFKIHEKNYFWKERASAVICRSANKEILNKLKPRLQQDIIEVYQIPLHSAMQADFDTMPVLDTLVQLYHRYDDCTIDIRHDGSTKNAQFSMKLEQWLNQKDIQTITIHNQAQKEKTDKILIQLNSKSKKSLEYQYNRESALNLQVSEGLFEKGSLAILHAVPWEKGINLIDTDSSSFLIQISNIIPSEPKTLKDVKGLVISDYQNYLEKSWLDQLKSKFDVSKNEATLGQIKKLYHKKLHHSK